MYFNDLTEVKINQEINKRIYNNNSSIRIEGETVCIGNFGVCKIEELGKVIIRLGKAKEAIEDLTGIVC